MTINGGSSALAEDFNSNLHEHFNVLRKHQMRPNKPSTGNEGSFAEEGENSREFIGGPPLPSGSHSNHAVIHHNPKTGSVRSETSPMSESGYPEQIFSKSPKKFSKNLSEAAEEAKNWDE